MMAPAPETVPAPVKEGEKTKKETYLGNQGKVIVQLPADAKLFVDGQPIQLSSSVRNVLTPELLPGQDYYYVVKATVNRDGQTVEDSKRVVVRAGMVSRVDFNGLPAAPNQEAKPARITVRIPEAARLYVDGVARPMTSTVRTFDTPELEPGQSYYYNFKVEVSQDGKTRSDDRRVIVQAGKDVTVDFTELKGLATAQR
jgi:uncharacterized protein (TIGR03000 family)